MPVRPVFPGEGNGSGTGAVNSVNGEQGDVIITAQDLNAQPASTVLTDIASIAMPGNSFLHTDGSGNFTPSLCMPAGVAWLSYTTVDQQKDHLALSEVASSGDYNDLSNKPMTFSGAYTDLTGKPILFSGNYADLSNKPVLFDGTYANLAGKPTSFVPSAHTHAINDITGLQASLDSKATTASLSAYVTNSSLTTTLTGYATNSALTSGLSSKYNTPTGTTLQYIRGDGSVATFPTIPSVPTNLSAFANDSGYITASSLPNYRRVDNSAVAAPIKVKYYTATSDSNSVWTVTLGTDFTEVLDVQVQPVSVANTVAGVRSASLNAYTSTSTSVSGVTYGNNVLTTVLVGVGANTLALSPTTVVRIRVEGK